MGVWIRPAWMEAGVDDAGLRGEPLGDEGIPSCTPYMRRQGRAMAPPGGGTSHRDLEMKTLRGISM